MYKKINQISSVSVTEPKINLYNKYEKQFDYFFNSDAIRENMKEINQFHIPDTDAEKKLKDLLVAPMDYLAVFIGYKGMGKTTDIKHTYQISNSAILLDSNHNTIFFPIFCKSFVTNALTIDFIMEDLTKRISSVCETLEDSCPQLRNEFYTPEGQKNFLLFTKRTNPKDLCDIRCDELKEDGKKLQSLLEKSPFVYYVTKLKYYLVSNKCKFKRLLFIVDDIESVLFSDIKILLLQYFKFFICAKNFPDTNEIDTNCIYINMLISLRPDTYHMILEDETLSSYKISKVLSKTRNVDLTKYFERKYTLLSNDIKRKEEHKWDEAYSIIRTFSEKFDKKYAKLIKRLSYMNIANSLDIYKKVFNNSVWIVEKKKGEEFEYVFNNITVLRAISCGNNLVYFDDDENIIPNIIQCDITGDNSNILLGIYILVYFINRHAEYRDYGQYALSTDKIITDFGHIFGKDIEKHVIEVINYFCKRGVLFHGINHGGNNALYLSSKGQEIWDMFSTDSVLMELYREDLPREFKENSNYSWLSSYDLTKNYNQVGIFIDLYIILEELLIEEKKMFRVATTNHATQKYFSMFGNTSLIDYLKSGIQKSIEYSGNSGVPCLIKANELLNTHINELFGVTGD